MSTKKICRAKRNADEFRRANQMVVRNVKRRLDQKRKQREAVKRNRTPYRAYHASHHVQLDTDGGLPTGHTGKLSIWHK